MDMRIKKDLRAFEHKTEKYLRSQYSNQAPQVAYHYTSWKGLQGILETRCIHATHFRDLEDTSEGTVADQHVCSAIDDLLQVVPHRVLRVLVDVRDQYERLKLSTFSENWFALHIACFCVEAERDHLWRTFGQSGEGYCLGLRVLTDEGYPDRNEYGMRTVHVEYDAEKQRVSIRSDFGRILEISGQYESATHPQMRKRVAARLLMESAAANVRFKSVQYSDEKEWRLVVMSRSAHHTLETVPGTARRISWPLRADRKPISLDSIHVGARNGQPGSKTRDGAARSTWLQS